MAEIKNLDDYRPHIEVTIDDKVYIERIGIIKAIADGETSIAEQEDPELAARILATIAMDYISDN